MKKFLFAFLLVFSSSHLQSEDITWSSPETLSSTMNDASNSRVGIDAIGDVESIWIENGFVYSSSYPAGGPWSAATSISNMSASNASLVVDPNGNATAIWLEGTALIAKTKPFGGSWGSATTLVASGASQPQIAIDPSGNVVAVWVSGTFVQSKTKMFGGSWQALADTLSLVGADSPQVAIGSGGKVVVVWHGLLSLVDTIFSSNKNLGGLWSLGVAISNPANRSTNAQVAVNSSGKAVAVWYIYTQTGGSFSGVYLQSSTLSGGLWSLPILVSDTQGYYDPSKLGAQIAFESNGTAVAAWRNSVDGSSFGVYSTILSPTGDGTWYTPEIGLVETNIGALGFDLSVPGALDAFLSYMVFDGAVTSVYSTVSNITAYVPNRWTFPDFLSTGTNNGFPQIAAYINGSTIYAAAVWMQSNMTTDVQASIGTGTMLQPPTGLGVVQSSNSFGIFTEYYNTISWTPSVSPDIISYLVFRDGLLIGEVLAPTTSFIDNNREMGAATTYGVASFDSKGTQSSVALVNYP